MDYDRTADTAVASGNGAAEIMPCCTALIHLLEYVTL